MAKKAMQAEPYELEFDPQTTALLIIDMQRDFVMPGGFGEALGNDVRDYAVGDRVCVLPTFRLGEYGVYGERAIVPASSLLPAPPALSPVEAASIWMQYLTALAIIEVAHATVGD